LIDVSENRFGNDRLAGLLRLLAPAPEAWVTKVKQTLLERLRSPAPAETRLTEAFLVRLSRALETDTVFQARFDADPVAAAEAAGMSDVAGALAHELRELVRLAERVAADEAYRAELEADPAATLAVAGIPLEGAPIFVEALELREDVSSKLPDVVAHEHHGLSLEARLVTLLLRSGAAIEDIRKAARRART
jgi:hypothetical protein